VRVSFRFGACFPFDPRSVLTAGVEFCPLRVDAACGLVHTGLQLIELRGTPVISGARSRNLGRRSPRLGCPGLRLRSDLNLPARFEDLAETVANALDAAAPRGPAAPYWIGMNQDAHHAQLADLRRWTDTVLRQHYSGYELPDCWPRHTHAIWELSTLAAHWHHTYRGPRPDLARALEFHDRWLPGTMRRIASVTRECRTQCVTLRSPSDWSARPSYR
jgi:hypothetical protein